MSALSIQVPFPVFQDRDGQPLENGYVWIGVANLNPQTNPVVAYYDAALTIPAPQPLRTLNGYVSRAGTPAQIYVDGVNFSILVQDSKGTMVYNFPDGTGISPDACGVTYDPPFTGAVAYPVCEKLEQTVSVKDFGAVGDGVADDTAAIQTAINTGRAIYIPAGTYLVSSLITIATDRQRIFGEKNKSVLIASGNHGILGPAGLFLALYTEVNGITFRAAVPGQGTGIFSNASPVWYLSHWDIVECSFEASLAFGINGTLITSTIRNCDFGNFGAGPNYQAIRSVGDAPFTSNINAVLNNEFTGSSNVDYVVEFQVGFKVIFENNIFEQNDVNIAVIYFYGLGYPYINNCWFEANTTPAIIKADTQPGVQDSILVTVQNSILDTNITPSIAIVNFTNSSNKNLVFNNNVVAGGNCPLGTAGTSLIEFVGNFSTNAGISALPNDRAFFGTGVEAKDISAEDIYAVDKLFANTTSTLYGTSVTNIVNTNTSSGADACATFKADYVTGAGTIVNGLVFQDASGTIRGTISWNNATTSYVTSSDYRLKENLTPMSNGLDKVMRLKPQVGNWKSNGASFQGFIAHELQAVEPDCVVGAKDAVDENGNPIYQGVDTSFLIATLTAAIQELKIEIDLLKAKLT